MGCPENYDFPKLYHYPIVNKWLVDYIVLGAYLIGITSMGMLAAKRVKSASTFFMGERKFTVFD